MAKALAEVPPETEEKPEPPPSLLTAAGEQLAFEGLPVSDRRVHIVGEVTIPGERADTLALGQVLELHVTAIVKSVSGKQKRDDWGDDKADVTWTLYAEDSSLA